jgi:uracil-DNA glycosylase
MQTQMIIGEGVRNAIMIIGEGPGRNEEEQGRPFVGKSGELLRQILDAYQLTPYCYITNIVVCRACEVSIDDQGQPRLKKRRGQPDEIMYHDVVPMPTQIKACAPRLYEEIYSVDPVVILALGVTAASFLLNRPISIQKERGITESCNVPGALWTPQLTEKKKVWARKVKGQDVLPVEQNQVRYTVIPTLHPAFVLRKEGDHGKDSPWNQLALDVKLAGEIYERYMLEAHGVETLMKDVDLDEEAVRHDGQEDQDSFK